MKSKCVYFSVSVLKVGEEIEKHVNNGYFLSSIRAGVDGVWWLCFSLFPESSPTRDKSEMP